MDPFIMVFELVSDQLLYWMLLFNLSYRRETLITKNVLVKLAVFVYILNV